MANIRSMTHKKNVKELKFKIFIYGTSVITNTMGCHTHSHPTPNISPHPPKKKMFHTFSRSYYIEEIIFVPKQTIHNYVL